MTINPYDQLAYRCAPIEWTAPDRLAVASLLHGGPRPARNRYRVLELGCGNGANLIPLAYYRPQADFVGIDGARTQVDIAQSRCSELGLKNIDIHHTDFLEADAILTGYFDYIIAHGILSWVDGVTRHTLLELCERRLAPDGLVYLNYNCRPGWNVRGMVRDFLLGQTAAVGPLGERAHSAQAAAAKMAEAFAMDEQPYSALLAGEFRFVCENDASYVAHEYLALHNHAFWRSEFMALAGQHGLAYVADADFSYSTGRVAGELPHQLSQAGIMGRSVSDTVDLLCNRQLHSPILAHAPLARRPAEASELRELIVASPLVRQPDSSRHAMFLHPSGVLVETKDDAMSATLAQLEAIWPRGARVADALPDSCALIDDLKLLHRNGLVDLRMIGADECEVDPCALNALEAKCESYATNAYHMRGHSTPANALQSLPV
jgi:SAM-dependent methyltransferase